MFNDEGQQQVFWQKEVFQKFQRDQFISQLSEREDVLKCSLLCYQGADIELKALIYDSF